MTRIPMGVTGISGVENNSLVLEIEAENVSGSQTADRVILTIQAQVRPESYASAKFQAANARLLSLTGILYAGREHEDPGAPLRAFRMDAPVYPPLGQTGFQLPLAFDLTRAYLQYLEDLRRKPENKPSADMVLKLKLWGTVAMISTASDDAGALTFGGIFTSGYPEATFRVPRSDWLDRILPAIGYDETVLIELPRSHHPTAPDDLKEAVQHLERARQHLKDDKYREAVQSCRQAKDALLKRNASGLTNMLAPWVGDGKAATADEVLGAFSRLFIAASHPKTRANEERIEFSRDDAAFVVNSLALLLDYIARVLNAQSVAE